MSRRRPVEPSPPPGPPHAPPPPGGTVPGAADPAPPPMWAPAGRAWRAVFSLMLGTVATRGRLVLLGLGGLVAVAVAVGLRGPVPDRAEAATELVAGLGLSLLVPLAALTVGTATLGDPRDDGTLVYLWLRPVRAWVVPSAAWAATVAVVVPVTVLPLTVAAAVASGDGAVTAGAALATGAAGPAYAALSVALGLRVRRAITWGFAYLLLWEGFAATASSAAARLAVRTHARSLLSWVSGEPLRFADVAPATAGVTLAAVTVAGLVYGAVRFARTEVP